MSTVGAVTRRAFMGLGAATAGGLAVGYYFYSKPFPNPLAAMAAEGDAVFNPYVRIATDNTITYRRASCGNGSRYRCD